MIVSIGRIRLLGGFHVIHDVEGQGVDGDRSGSVGSAAHGFGKIGNGDAFALVHLKLHKRLSAGDGRDISVGLFNVGHNDATVHKHINIGGVQSLKVVVIGLQRVRSSRESADFDVNLDSSACHDVVAVLVTHQSVSNKFVSFILHTVLPIVARNVSAGIVVIAADGERDTIESADGFLGVGNSPGGITCFSTYLFVSAGFVEIDFLSK